MGLFDKIAGAMSDPNLQASAGQIGSILGSLQETSNTQNLDNSTTQALMSVVGSQVRGALQEKKSANGMGGVQGLINQFAGTGFNPQAVSALFSPQQQEQVVQSASQNTGVNAATIQALLPTLVPLVLNFLKTGEGQNSAAGANPVLNSFLDSDGDGDVDMGDVMKLAGRFLK
ncbi:DUF937 domain-containing protein [Oscillatoriales cyanobacterium LEGE 11467]|uniref:DUF937 domain-containing protein n=1 Tax=Zarconia navalis LEGE 11467 TaxID=1828826 RepID=A0A928W0S9_9CYAN|nr:hypothetical protein [Zarconia navalis]MBE9041195.1 DUF937 domain-containing protein [Zarconia navalis LEGE 11467]